MLQSYRHSVGNFERVCKKTCLLVASKHVHRSKKNALTLSNYSHLKESQAFRLCY